MILRLILTMINRPSSVRKTYHTYLKITILLLDISLEKCKTLPHPFLVFNPSKCYFLVINTNILNKGLLIWTATQSVITCSKVTIETLEQGVKYVQS